MNLLILKGFNNYFNRKIKKYSEVDDYKTNSSKYYNFSDINFNPNDGVVTEQVIGSVDQLDSGNLLDWERDGSPDYIVCYETVPGTIIVDDEEVETSVDQIVSRWFVLESVRTRAGQYKLALKRDVIADHLAQILSNPCFVEKGYVKYTDPLIFNEENVSLNQIKNYKGNHPEVMLKDKTEIPWLVIYLAQNAPKDNAQPVYGKQILDTQDALDYSDLPWAGIESGANMANTTQIRRVPGAGEINISPIVAYKHKSTGAPEMYTMPSRANCRFLYTNNDWSFDNNTSNSYYIGKENPVWQDDYALTRRNINLTPGSNLIRWSNDGAKVPTWIYKDIINTFNDTNGNLIQSEIEADLLLSIAKSRINNAKTYLNGKRTWLESSTGHSTVPGNPNMEAWVGGPQSFNSASTLLSYNNKLVTYDNINYYRIKITRANNYTRPIDYFTLVSSTIQTSTTNTLATSLFYDSGLIPSDFEKNTDNSMVETFFEHAWFDIQYEKVTADLITCTIQPQGSNDRLQLNDCAYDMICLPYGAIDFKVTKGASVLSKTSTKEASIGIARAIAAKLGSSVYDMQLLPYCPWQAAVNDYVTNGYINITGTTSPGSQTLATGCWFGVYKILNEADTPDRENTVTFGLWCPQSHGSFDIQTPTDIVGSIGSPIYPVDTTDEEITMDYKVRTACKKFRLVGPNYSSIFEFNPLKNGGVNQFNVDYNYRPFNPYIHISPVFNKLYGVDTNDNRGLILQGDFSVGYYSDKWAEYQIQNANYANIFDRQLQNIDSNQKLEREQTRTQYGMNIATEFLGLGGGLKGASAGSAGGPWGALIGGIAGTVGGGAGSIAGAALDERWLNWSQKEARSYAIDMYNLNLGNVKALPYGLAKSDAQTENFKYFPFIEEYDCTEKEVEIFKSKLKYDGMTVDAIGTIAEYLPENNYEFQKIKGRMIMIENITDDFHIADDIYTEINKGFYYVPNIEVEPEGE